MQITDAQRGRYEFQIGVAPIAIVTVFCDFRSFACLVFFWTFAILDFLTFRALFLGLLGLLALGPFEINFMNQIPKYWCRL